LHIPKWSAFKSNSAVKSFLAHLVKEKTFSIGSVKRGMHLYLLETEGASLKEKLGRRKPNGLVVTEMFRPDMFECGEVKVQDHTLLVDRMDEYHVPSCDTCSKQKSVQESCYFFAMRKCITHGWKPLIQTELIKPAYLVEGNYASMELYHASTAKEFGKMILHKVVQEVSDGTAGLVSPMGAVVKNSDKRRALVITGVSVKDQASMTKASTMLESKGFPPIKARVTHDLTASGLNASTLTPAFRYPGLADGLKMIKRGCWLAKGDVSRYFHSFPLASESRPFFLLRFLGACYMLLRCCFGFSPCPYYCSAWSAEFRRWALFLGIECCHMMDDWLTVGSSEEEARRNIRLISNMLETVGFAMAADKEAVSQRLVFLGVLICTVNMKLSFDAVQAKGMKHQLSQYLRLLQSAKELDRGTIRHIAGCINWYAEVVQSGRLHNRSWWQYYTHGRHLSYHGKQRLIADTSWWIDMLDQWSREGHAGPEYSIISADELLSTPDKLVVMQSDAAGEDGFGYYYGGLEEVESKFVSVAWGGQFTFDTSHNGELQALLHFLLGRQTKDQLIIWVSDALAAVWSINKGRCYEDVAFETLSRILTLCDNLRCQILALWVPREQNTLADYLSHLSRYANRPEVRGEVSGGGLSNHSGREPEPREELQGSPGDRKSIRVLVPSPRV
jgi:hypothetical protein